MVRLTDSPAMILVVYSGRKETKEQKNKTTTTHTASVIRHMPSIRIRVTKKESQEAPDICHNSLISISAEVPVTVCQGPVVQSVVSLTSSLRVISLTVLADSIYNILIFFAEKM